MSKPGDNINNKDLQGKYIRQGWEKEVGRPKKWKGKTKEEVYKEEIEEITFKVINRMLQIHKGKKQKKIDSAFEKYTSHLMELKENWEGQSKNPFTEETIKKAKELARNIMNYFSDQRIELSIPKILPVPDGTIDIKWKEKGFRLIVNIPRNLEELVEVYGDIKGHPEDEIDLRLNYEILLSGCVLREWLKKALRRG